MTCASTGKAAVAISGTTIHTALKISSSRLVPLNSETAQQYRTLFKYIKVTIVADISRISAQLLLKVDSRLKQITGNFQSNFGGLDIILIGDFRQLPPVGSTPIYKQPKQTLVGPILWRNLNFYELNEVKRINNFLLYLQKLANHWIKGK
ncbi:ATP-dependent DNA helicase [Trichonephila clavipes]|uniref:ATP-dependent DNA helicase n=1 Tax=Trichonephila clavipes TaxID=2585209 RepID=A0A8X6RUM5_TRICX|nr:ATP-dependent DNA helicase [Trichonephila clavipes]